MGFLLSMCLIAFVAFSSFCFYAGVSLIGENIKNNGLYEVVKVAIITFVATAIVLICISRLNNSMFGRPSSSSRIEYVRV